MTIIKRAPNSIYSKGSKLYVYVLKKNGMTSFSPLAVTEADLQLML